MAKRYIDADTLMKWLNDRYDWEKYSVEEFVNVVKGQPTADVVEVVRCEDCSICLPEGWCPYMEMSVSDNDYCSFGERRENNDSFNACPFTD